MKTRADFVSNSSSSSFICCPEDASDIELFNESETMNLHEYLRDYGECDIFYYNWFRPTGECRFVSDKKFCKMFAKNIQDRCLPESAREAYEMHGHEWEKIMPYVEDVLRPVWGDIVLEKYEAEDCNEYLHTDEESYLNALFNKREMKFKRIFNNH